MICLLLLSSCGEITYTPKPRGFPKIDFPEGTYQAFDQDFCNFTFEYPEYAEIQQDTVFFEDRPIDPCWFNIYIPAFDSHIYCSYYPIPNTAKKDFEALKRDAFGMASYHSKKANYIDEIRIQNPNGADGFAFDIQGPAASPFQFYLSDSTSHFLRGALYFNTKARPDSMAPVYDFVKTDILKMLETFKWTDVLE